MDLLVTNKWMVRLSIILGIIGLYFYHINSENPRWLGPFFLVFGVVWWIYTYQRDIRINEYGMDTIIKDFKKEFYDLQEILRFGESESERRKKLIQWNNKRKLYWRRYLSRRKIQDLESKIELEFKSQRKI